MAWAGLGVNFANTGTASYAHALEQLTVVKQYTDKVRIHLPDYQTQSSIDGDLDLCRAAVALGFSEVVWGVSSNRYNIASNAITQRNWPTFRQKIIDYAVVAQGIGITHYQCGNEEELHIYIVPTSVTRTSNVVTAVLPFSPDYQIGDTVYIEDATPSTFNGTFTLTNKVGATLTWAQAGADTSTSAAKVTDFTKAQLRTNLRGVVASVKAVFSGRVSTAVSQDDYVGWVSDANKGSFDLITYNIYGNNSLDAFITQTAALLAVYPGMEITEFNMHSGWSNTVARGIPVTGKGFDKAYTYEMQLRLKALRDLGISKAYFFTWHNNNDSFAVQLADGGVSAVVRLFVNTRTKYGVIDY